MRPSRDNREQSRSSRKKDKKDQNFFPSDSKSAHGAFPKLSPSCVVYTLLLLRPLIRLCVIEHTTNFFNHGANLMSDQSSCSFHRRVIISTTWSFILASFHVAFPKQRWHHYLTRLPLHQLPVLFRSEADVSWFHRQMAATLGTIPEFIRWANPFVVSSRVDSLAIHFAILSFSSLRSFVGLNKLRFQIPAVFRPSIWMLHCISTRRRNGFLYQSR